MLRKVVLSVAVAALFGLIPAAQAAQGDWTISMLGGISVPTGDFGQKIQSGGLGAKMGFGTGASIDYKVAEQVALGVDGYFASNGLNREERDLLRTVDPTVDLRHKQLGAAVHVKYWLPMSEGPTNAYVVGGGGLVHFKTELEAQGVTISASENKFMGYAGLGFGYDVARNVAVGVESDIRFVTLTGVTATSVGVRGGLSFDILRTR